MGPLKVLFLLLIVILVFGFHRFALNIDVERKVVVRVSGTRIGSHISALIGSEAKG